MSNSNQDPKHHTVIQVQNICCNNPDLSLFYYFDWLCSMFSWLLCIFTTDRLPKGVLSCLFQGCWRIFTSQRIQTNYASSPGKAKVPLWASVKPSPQWLSWGDSHCPYFWQRVEGGCTWGPGCTGHSWGGFGWMCSPSKRRQARGLCHPPEQCDPDVEECLIRDSYLSQPWAEIWGDAEKCEAFYAPYTCYLNSLPAADRLFRFVQHC